MTIISVNMLKGGVSKSLLSTSLYWYLIQQGHNVGLVDGDTQSSLVKALDKHEDVDVIARDDIPSWEALRRVQADYLIIDTPPAYAYDEIAGIYAVSDFVLMPCTASEPDVRSLVDTLAWYKEAKEKRPEMKAAIVETQSKPNTLASLEFRQYVENALGIPLLKSRMMHRVAYKDTWSAEGGIYSSDNEKAKKEITSIATEILTMIGHGTAKTVQ